MLLDASRHLETPYLTLNLLLVSITMFYIKGNMPLESGFALGTQREGTISKQHVMPKANPTLGYQTRHIFHWLALWVALGIQGLALGIQRLALGPQAFQIPPCWYSQCEPLVLGAVPNTNLKTQREWFYIAVG